MFLQDAEKWAGAQGGQEGRPLARSNARGLSIDRGKDIPKATLEDLLSSTLRSEDAELDQILSALEEISSSIKSGAATAPNLDNALQRAAWCAVKQTLQDREVRSLAITDELTGFYNRRGFLATATHQLKLAFRHAQEVLLFFCDIDDMKGINDAFGHREGDLAIVRAADVLEETFRDSDILARLGGDEFVMLALETSIPSRRAVMPRIEKSLKKANAEESRYKLSFSIGVARFHPKTPSSLGELMARADQDMDLHKKCDHRLASLRHS
ncbi:MAG: GGDEF domain-containing protein [Candidatus Acidiferrum sp.]